MEIWEIWAVRGHYDSGPGFLLDHGYSQKSLACAIKKAYVKQMTTFFVPHTGRLGVACDFRG